MILKLLNKIQCQWQLLYCIQLQYWKLDKFQDHQSHISIPLWGSSWRKTIWRTISGMKGIFEKIELGSTIVTTMIDSRWLLWPYWNKHHEEDWSLDSSCHFIQRGIDDLHYEDTIVFDIPLDWIVSLVSKMTISSTMKYFIFCQHI